MSRRDQIRMSPPEVRDFLTEQRVINVATMGPNGRPHLTPLWYVPKDGDGDDGVRIETWTYGKSQKVANLRRLAQATLLVESGKDYEELRGVSMETDVELIDDDDRALAIGADLMRRYTLGGPEAEIGEDFLEILRVQATKRTGLVFTPTKIISWDHSKLGGAY
ncbi:pyridoxamine 5'-phosphate oxidase family protein [Haloechinothrix sp. LS1_15]|uniref:pyridoxamine 5'-phosphate oxidase family protein n=1 Tax=Haloechinothrix sp. LS1_15 TaxID=2652248 RepID=UPI002944164E|nr:pyridoxamine 5'-phosphate oxidase family protein [Haloechinothrix sp. LS1_15]MDV6011172.1 pyridoxamine 5'-phosphate oxidase [Haloechinothrix sp. LS1_15]